MLQAWDFGIKQLGSGVRSDRADHNHKKYSRPCMLVSERVPAGCPTIIAAQM
jgi:hypothetical protein